MNQMLGHVTHLQGDGSVIHLHVTRFNDPPLTMSGLVYVPFNTIVYLSPSHTGGKTGCGPLMTKKVADHQRPEATIGQNKM